jgi:adenylate cyclase
VIDVDSSQPLEGDATAEALAPPHDAASPPARAAAWRRLNRRMALALSAANVTGALIVFVFLGLVVPTPSSVAYDWSLFWLNLAVFVPGLVLSTVLANVWGPRRAAPVRAWFVAGRAPDAHERAVTLRQPLEQMKVAAAIWAGALVLFTTINAFVSVALAALVAFTVALGGLSSSALTYLLAERIGRELTAAALVSGVPEEPAGPGVATRVLLAWALAAGVPLLGGVLLAFAVLTGADVSAEQVAGSVLFLGVVGLAFGLIAMRIAARSVADPVESVRGALREVQRGNLEAEVSVYDSSEVGLLQAGFNRMVAGLRERERLREAFGTFIDPKLAERILRQGTDLAGEELEVSILFMDVRGFTTYSEGASAREVVARLNDLYEQVVPVIVCHGGNANKFIGDGLLAVFGAPERLDDHADRAVAAAVEIAALVRERYGGELRVGIGVNSGRVMAGTIGGGGRLDFTVIGDPVNTAARVESATRQTDDDLLITESTRRLLDGDQRVWIERPAIPLKGKAEQVRLYAPGAARRAAS